MRYSLGNEDCRTEHEALKIRPGDRVVCVTSSGDRPLHLLLADASEVACIDPNPAHNQLLALKKAALKELSYEQYLAFLGLVPSDNRYEMWLQIRKALPNTSQIFWDQKYRLIEKGILYQGSIEKWCRRIARVFKLVRKQKVAKLFSFTDIDKQREFLEEWDTKWVKNVCNIVTKMLIPGNSNNDYLYSRVQNYLKRHLAKDSPLLSLALRGKISNENLPPYLSRLGAALIRSRLERMSHEDSDILSYLKNQPSSSIDVFSLSDVSSYVDEKQFEEIVIEMVRTAKQGARFCLRQLLSEHRIPEVLQFSIRRDPHLEKKLEEEDRTFVYRFTIGTIQK
jgi:S-adenosylmethionine-diacylglycerol 3-amino-3-carboxypropyl transferase